MVKRRSSEERVLSAALAIFNEAGVNAASIHDICDRAGVSIGSAYHHFESKKGIADALLIGGLRSNAQALAKRLSRVGGAEAGIRTVVESLVDWIEAHADWARFIYTVSDARAQTPELLKVNAEYGALIDAYFGPLIRAQELRHMPRDMITAVVVGPVHHLAKKILNDRPRPSLVPRKAHLADAAWRAVRPD